MAMSSRAGKKMHPFPEEKIDERRRATIKLLSKRSTPNEIINKGLLPGMKVIGENLETGNTCRIY
jgi:methanogenic corrinoid protein MtbC1